MNTVQKVSGNHISRTRTRAAREQIERRVAELEGWAQGGAPADHPFSRWSEAQFLKHFAVAKSTLNSHPDLKNRVAHALKSIKNKPERSATKRSQFAHLREENEELSRRLAEVLSRYTEERERARGSTAELAALRSQVMQLDEDRSRLIKQLREYTTVLKLHPESPAAVP